MGKTQQRSRALFVGLVGLVTSVTVSAATAEDFYAGKTITVIVGASAGSGGDVSARTFMKGLSEHIPGKPNIIVRNMEGAGGGVALNFIHEKGDPDGLTFYYGNWDPMGAVAGAEGIRYLPETFGVVGSAANERGTIIRTDIKPGIKSPEGIAKASRVRVGGRAASNTNDMIGNLALTLLGADFRYISGFRSMGKMAPGIMSGELQAGHTAAGGFSRFFVESTKGGETMMLYYHPFFDEEGAEIKPSENLFHEGVPSLSALYERIHGKPPSGLEWETYKWLRTNVHATSPAMIAPPKTPEEYLEVLRAAFQATWNDQAFREQWKAQFGSLPHVNSTQSTISSFKNYKSISEDQLGVVERMIALGR